MHDILKAGVKGTAWEIKACEERVQHAHQMLRDAEEEPERLKRQFWEASEMAYREIGVARRKLEVQADALERMKMGQELLPWAEPLVGFERPKTTGTYRGQTFFVPR